MKTIYHICVLLFLMSMVSCTEKDDKGLSEDIIGSFSYTKTDDRGIISVTINGVETFNKDSIVTDESVVSFFVSMNDLGDIAIKYQLKYEGTYKIENSYIIYDFSEIENNSSVELLSIDGSFENKELIELLREQVEASIFPDIKNMLTTEHSAKIHKLNRKRLVVMNPEGEEWIKKRT